MDTVHVKIADLAVQKDKGILVTFGLGSCVGIALYDSKLKIGGLAHILLNDSSKFIRPNANTVNPAKFADTAIPFMLDQMLKMGVQKPNLVAKIAGGASLFNFKSDSGSVGDKNIEAVRAALKQLGLKIVFEDVGGCHGRTMRLFVDSGEVTITTAGKGDKKS
jgi:chemotaxis protein CheD